MSAAEEAELPARRLRELIEHLGTAVGKRRGWKAEVARMLGIHPSYVTKLAAGDVTRVGTDVVERVASRAGLPLSFFFEEGAGIPEFARAFSQELGQVPPPPDVPRPAVYAELLETAERGGRVAAEIIRRITFEDVDGAIRPVVSAADARAIASAVRDLPYSKLAAQIDEGRNQGLATYRLCMMLMHLADVLQDADDVASRLLAHERIQPDELAWFLAGSTTGRDSLLKRRRGR